MKRYLEYIKENKKSTTSELSLYDQWMCAICFYNSKKIKEIIDKGFDVNFKDGDNNTALTFLSNEFSVSINYKTPKKIKECIKVLLEDPNIDITVKTEDDNYFIENINEARRKFLIDYDMQKKIIDNKRDDIILFLDKYGLIHPDIKIQYPILFKTKNWGLIS